MAKEKQAKVVIPVCNGDYCCKRAVSNGYCLGCEVKYNASQQSGTASA